MTAERERGREEGEGRRGREEGRGGGKGRRGGEERRRGGGEGEEKGRGVLRRERE